MTYNVIFTKKKKARRIKNENHCVYNNELIVVKKKKRSLCSKKMYKFLQVILHTCRNAEEAYLRAY